MSTMTKLAHIFVKVTLWQRCIGNQKIDLTSIYGADHLRHVAGAHDIFEATIEQALGQVGTHFGVGLSEDNPNIIEM